jgi:2,3-bisphosphoglycerate-independent phosphoglycerate mutase
MDRDNRWERIELAYRALVHGQAEARSSDPVRALTASYESGVSDEFVKPVVITRGEGAAAEPVGLVRDDDAVIFYNFRADRARQMTCALAAPGFDKFVDPERPENLFYVAMTQYDKNWPWLKSVIQPEKLEHILAAPRKPKNTRTSPIFSTAAWKNPSRAKSASWCRPPRWRPTICSRKCRRRGLPIPS